jgi:ATP-dependent DNA helicase RecQ
MLVKVVQMPVCPKCGAPMVKKVAKKGMPDEHLFWSCTKFPACRGSMSLEVSDEDFKTANDVAPIRFVAEPYVGFDAVDSYETIACDSAVLRGLRNELLDAEMVKTSAKFRVEYTESPRQYLNRDQRQIVAIVLRMLCRGSITRNSSSVESAITKLFPGNVEYTNNEFSGSRFLTRIAPDYPFDSERERFFAETILHRVLGANWPLFSSAQVYIQTIASNATSATSDMNFAGQRTDFFISDGNRDFIIEIDGEEHTHHTEKDAQRDAFLQNNGYKVFRFKNTYVDGDQEFVVDTLSNDIKTISKSGNPSSTTQKRIVAAKLVHQLQIAMASALYHGTMSNSCRVGIEASIDGISTDDIKEILQIAIDDLGMLFANYCDLYGQEHFFEIATGDNGCDATLCIGAPAFKAPATILITDITAARTIENVVPACSEIEISEVEEDTLLYFLEYVFHFKCFREGQETAITRLLKEQDSIVLLPTGSGKSLIYQLAALMCPGKIIVVSPLVSLMQDQLDNLFYAGIDCALTISSDHTIAPFALNNPGTVLIYISPERLQIKGFRDCINNMQSSSRVYAVAVDEAHCVSEWGHDFRTAYLNIGRTSRTIFNRGGRTPTIIALTGTASSAVLKDVKRELGIAAYDAVITPETFDRKELKFKVVQASSDRKKEELVELCDRAIPDFFGKSSASFYRLRNDDTQCGIVFCPHANGDYGVTKVRGYLSNIPETTDVYSGKAPKGAQSGWNFQKNRVANEFKSNKINTLVATKAFGMGIDKPNVRFTVHYGVPSSIESFYQEAGRAGRDGKEALCSLILSEDNERLDDYILNPTTSLERVQEVVDSQTRDQRDDITRMLYFHVGSFKGINFEMRRIEDVVDKLFVGNTLSQNDVIITCVSDDKENSSNNVQKALQRLLVLGVIMDYTVDYSSREFRIKPGSIEPTDVQAQYALYVKGYNEGRIVKELHNLMLVPEDPRRDYILNAARVLTEFVYDTIEKGRRRGLREMVNAAKAALNSRNPDGTLRSRIVRYFESTYSEELTTVVESTKLGFEKIPEIIDGVVLEAGGEMVGGIRSANEAAGLRGGVARYLESTPDHPGLLALRALAELHCKYANVNLIRDDFEAACNFAINRYSCDRKTLLSFAAYFMRKVIERDETMFAALVDGANSFIDRDSLCAMLIDDQVLAEEQKTSPAIVYFSDMAKKSIGHINKLKGE